MTRKLIYTLLGVVMIITSCKKTLDINTDPNNPVSLPESKLLPLVEKNLGTSLAMSPSIGGLSQLLSVYMHQVVVREDPDQYGANGSDFNIQNNWTTFYISFVTNVNAIISEGKTNGNMKYVGIAEILKAYGFSQMVDAYGDIPFAEAGGLIAGVRNPHFDKSSAIYPQLLALLDQGIADMSAASTGTLTPGSDDVIYQGSVTSWTKAANTIKLKLLMQQRLITPSVATAINALIAGGNLISKTSESFVIPYGVNGATDDRNPGYDEYFASQRGTYTSPWFYEILKGRNARILNGITDPRIPYYFFNQIKATTAEANPVEYRDGAFISIYFGSQGPNAAQIQQNYMTVQGIYPVGGRYDDGNGAFTGSSPTGVTSTSSTGSAPYRLITYADVLFMEAEMQQVGLITGAARTTFQAAMTEAFAQVDYVVGKVANGQSVPALAGNAATTTYINNVLAQYDLAANTITPNPINPAMTPTGALLNPATTQLEYIMTEKWISSFGSSVDQYTDYRRTGWPFLFNPNNRIQVPLALGNNQFGLQPPVNGDPNGTPEKPVVVQLTRNYPVSLPWYTTELETNINAPAPKNDPSLSTYKVFWNP